MLSNKIYFSEFIYKNDLSRKKKKYPIELINVTLYMICERLFIFYIQVSISIRTYPDLCTFLKTGDS